MSAITFGSAREYRGIRHIRLSGSCTVNGRSSWGYRIECAACGTVDEYAHCSSVTAEDGPARFAYEHRECAPTGSPFGEAIDRHPNRPRPLDGPSRRMLATYVKGNVRYPHSYRGADVGDTGREHGPCLMSDGETFHATLHGTRQSRTVKIVGMLRTYGGPPMVDYVTVNGLRATAPLSWIDFRSPLTGRYAPTGYAL